RIETPRRFDKAEVAFVDQVERRNAAAAIALRVADDEAKVALDELRQGVIVAIVADAVTERAFFVDAQPRQSGHPTQIRSKCARLASIRIPLRHARTIHRKRRARHVETPRVALTSRRATCERDVRRGRDRSATISRARSKGAAPSRRARAPFPA